MIHLPIGRASLAGVLIAAVAYTGTAQDTKPAPTNSAGAAVKEPNGKPSFVSPQTQKINELVRQGYASAPKGGIKKSSPPATDHEFIRRVFIDLIGRIATPDEVIDFENDKSPDKRVKLVQRLLYDESYQPKRAGKRGEIGKGKNGKAEFTTYHYTDQYAEHWANLWTVWLMSRSGHPDYREQMRVWLAKQFTDNVSHKEMVVKLITATGQVGGAKTGEGWPYKDAYAANFIVHHLGEPIREERGRDGAFDAVPITSRVTKLFLGLQTQCTQCHDHPFNKEWMQSDFWGVNAFFRQTVRSATPSGPPMGRKGENAALVTLTDDSSLNTEMLVFYERRDGRRLGSFPIMLKDYGQAMNGEKSAKMLGSDNPAKTRRQQLSEWVVGHDNFAKAYVNRIWSHLFGRGLNKEPSADDFGSNNDIVHPELLNFLGEEFAKYNYDPKRLLEWICTSEAYQLSHVAQPQYTDIVYEPFFARMPLKAMSPEVLFEALMTATKPGKRTASQQAEHKATKDAWMRKLVRQFGDDEGNELSFNGTIVQALLMMNGKELNDEIGSGRGASATNVVADILKRPGMSNSHAVYEELFLMTLNRRPTEAEKKQLDMVRDGKASVSSGPASKPTKGPAPKRPLPKRPIGKTPPAKGPTNVQGVSPAELTGFYQDVLWALLNTNEFMLNH